MYEIPKIWAGSQSSFEHMLEAMASAEQMMQARAAVRDPFELPPLVAVQEGVGIVDIRGPLVSGSAGFMRLFGVTGYADIQEAMMQAAEDKSVKSLMLNVASGGGDVEGADETSVLIRSLSSLKPVLTFASGTMASAALWLGSAGTRRLASATSIVGSIGVTTTHIDRSKQLEKEGINATVFRSGKWKALINSVEPLSETAKEHLQSLVQDLNVIFESRVASNLGVSAKAVHDKMGQGREFLGARAYDAGLVDGISNLQEAFAAAKILGRG